MTIMQGEILASQGKISSNLKQKPQEVGSEASSSYAPAMCLSRWLWGFRVKSSIFGSTVFVFLIMLHGQVSFSG